MSDIDREMLSFKDEVKVESRNLPIKFLELLGLNEESSHLVNNFDSKIIASRMREYNQENEPLNYIHVVINETYDAGLNWFEVHQVFSIDGNQQSGTIECYKDPIHRLEVTEKPSFDPAGIFKLYEGKFENWEISYDAFEILKNYFEANEEYNILIFETSFKMHK